MSVRVFDRRLLVGLVLVVSAAALLPVSPAEALPDPDRTGRFQVAPGVVRDTYTWQTSRGPTVIQIVRFNRSDPRVAFRPELGRGTVPGREATHETLRRLGPTAVAAVNGTFYRQTPGPVGEPEGLYIRNRTFISDAQQRFGSGWRGGFALWDDGTYAVGYPDYYGRLTQPDGHKERINGINRHPARPDAAHPSRTEITVFNRAFGPTTLTPPGTTEFVLENLSLGMRVDETRAIARVSTAGNSAIPANGVVVAASGQLGVRYRNLKAGHQIGIGITTTIDWFDPRHALAAGPLLIKDGVPRTTADWNKEGFDQHNTIPHPRTIIGFTAGGETMLITADGRQPGYSNGLTSAEAAHLMEHLGVRDAVMMDGGGATTMAVDARIRNRPCCDSGGFRSVSNSLVVFSTVDTPDVRRLGASDVWATGRQVALDGWPNGARVAVVVSGESPDHAVTAGPLAARHEAPILLTGRTWLPAPTAATLDALGTEVVFVVGNSDTVGGAVLDAMRARGLHVIRVGGATNVATAAAVAHRVGAPDRHAFLVSDRSWADAAGATVAASRRRAPILLTGRDSIPEATLHSLTANGVRDITVVGGSSAISELVILELRARGYNVSRVAGADHYGTIAALNATSPGLSTRRLVLTHGDRYHGLLVAGAYGAVTGVPVVASHPLDIDRSPSTRSWLNGRSPHVGILVGGRESLATWIGHQVQAIVVPGPKPPPPDTSDACPAGRVPPTAFADVSGVHKPGIECVIWWEVAQGLKPTTYAPRQSVTRGQMATFMVNTILEGGGALPSGSSVGFSDIHGNPHATNIRRLAAAGVVSGHGDGTFRPSQRVTRAQMATFLVNAYAYVSGQTPSSGTEYFDDIAGNPHRGAINAAAHAGLTSGLHPWVYNPAGPVRRDQMASFLARMLNRLVVEGATAPPDAR